jgi:hypothetical protein
VCFFCCLVINCVYHFTSFFDFFACCFHFKHFVKWRNNFHLTKLFKKKTFYFQKVFKIVNLCVRQIKTLFNSYKHIMWKKLMILRFATFVWKNSSSHYFCYYKNNIFWNFSKKIEIFRQIYVLILHLVCGVDLAIYFHNFIHTSLKSIIWI